MAELPDDIKKHKKITDIAIPGSHDSGTYSLNKKLPVGPDEDDIIQKLGNNPFLGKLVKFIMFRWSTTQHSSIEDQLNQGVRYFDFRIGKVQNHYRILHGLYGEDIFNILDDIQRFVGNHTKEIIILHFQHFFNMSNEDHVKIISKIETNFGSKLLKHDAEKEMPTIEEMQSSNKQIIAFYNPLCDQYDYLWPNNAIVNPWANTMDVTLLFKFLLNHLAKRPQNNGKVYVTQAVLTPNVKTILKKPFSTLFKSTKSVRKALPAWITDDAKSLNPNIIMTDFVSDTQICALIIALNDK